MDREASLLLISMGSQTPGVGDGQGGLIAADFHGVAKSQTQLSD